MQPKLISKSALSASIAAILSASSMNALAANETFSVGFTTVPDIQIIQIQPMDFGDGLGLNNSDRCVMDVTEDSGTDGKGYVGDLTMNLANSAVASTNTPSNTPGALTGTGCEFSTAAGATGTVGIYEVQGIPGGTVFVTVNGITGATDFNYIPQGCIGDYDNATTNDGDDCVAVNPNNPVQVTLANSDDAGNTSAGEGNPVPGRTRIALGGDVIATQAHSPGQLLTETFTIDVTY